MATYRAISTGVASALARWEVWDGAAWVAATVLPMVGDDVYANTFTVTIDIDFYTSSVRTTSTIGVSANGKFILNAGITLVGDVYTGQNVADSGAVEPSTGTTVIVGNVYNSQPSINVHGVRKSTSGLVRIVGNIVCNAPNPTSTFNNSCTAVKISGAAQAEVMGNCDAFGGNNGFFHMGARNDTGTRSNFIIRGRAKGVGFTSCYGAYLCEVNEIEGIVHQCTVYGTFVMSTTNTSTWTTCVAKTGASLKAIFYNQAGQQVICGNIVTDQAAPSNVRLGVVYANGALTGTAAIPPAASVALNVPVDNTVGGYVLTVDTNAIISGVTSGLTASLPSVLSQPLAEDLLTEISTSSNPVAERLRNVSTVQTTGSQLTALTIS
jgi:hypothetical protein